MSALSNISAHLNFYLVARFVCLQNLKYSLSNDFHPLSECLLIGYSSSTDVQIRLSGKTDVGFIICN